MKRIYIPIALLLMGIGLLLRSDTTTLPIKLPNFFGVGNVCIIEETKDRATLPAEQIAIITSTTLPAAIQKAGGTFLGYFDKDIVDRDKKQPKELVPYLNAAKKLGSLPALTYDGWFGVKAIPLPPNEQAALEAIL